MHVSNQIKSYLSSNGADFIHFVDISGLPRKQNKGYTKAVLFGIVLSASYLGKVSKDPNHLENMIRNNEIQKDEFHLGELKTDKLADGLTKLLQESGFEAYSQSEANIEASGFYDKENLITPLPHKTLALMAGMGWIGKHNLLVTKDFGSGISMCSVLFNAPVEAVRYAPQKPFCGSCNRCVKICVPGALTGKDWDINKPRENTVNVKACNTCYQCVVQCPWTQKYITGLT